MRRAVPLGPCPLPPGQKGHRALSRPRVPVTMTVRMRVPRRAWMTGVVCGFSTFLMTNSPRRLSCCSTESLQGGSEVTERAGPTPSSGPCPLAGLPLPMPEAWFPGPTWSVAELPPDWV